VTVTPAAGQTGSATITVTVSDAALTTSDTFVLVVNAQATGLVAAYGFNEGTGTSAADVSGIGNNGVVGSATWTATGKYGGALSFNGSTARVNINDSPSLRLTTGMTLEAWVNPSTVSSAWRDVIYKGDDNYYLMGTTTSSSRPALGAIFGASTYGEVYGTGALTANVWTHLAGTYDGTTERLYLNGVQVASRAQTGNILTSANPLTIGGDSFYGQYFSGMIDEVRIYNRALSAAEIQTDMNTPVGGTPPVNTAPTISDITDRTITEDANTGALTFTIGDGQTAVGSLTVSGSSSNPALVPNANIVFGGSGASRTVTVTPLANQNGTATITVTVSDGLLTASDTFLLTVSAVNDAPTISDVPDQSTTLNTATAAIPVTVGDVETAAGSLTMSGSSSNTGLVPNGNIVFGGSGANRTVTVTPAVGQTGTATITVTVTDGALSASDTFVLTVLAVNTAPTISDITDRTINEDASTGAITFTVGDGQTAAGSLTVTGGSSNAALVPSANIVFGGSGANRTVTVTPQANQNGTATITVTVSDGLLTTSDTFILTVNPVNDAPTISNIADQSTSPGIAAGPISFTINDLETAPGSLTVSGTSSNTGLVPNGNIVFGGSGANRTVTVTPAAGQTGSATITVTVSDAALTTSDTFVLAVTGNSSPTIGPIPDQVAFVDQPVIIKLELNDAETDVNLLQLSLSTTDSNLIRPEDYLFRYFITDGHRYLTIAGAFGQTGRATNTVTVSDGTTSASTTFVMTVLPPPPGAARFANASLITLPNVGPASTYPSVINVSGMNGTITNLNLTVSRLSHEYTTDLNMLLLGPDGTSVVFLSHAGGPNLLTNVTFTVSDSAAFPFDSNFPIWSEIFTPTSYSNVSFPAPAPAGPYSSVAFSNYFGRSANGPWSLYVFDENAEGNPGSIAGWSLMIATGNSPPSISDVPDQLTTVNTATAAIPVIVGDAETPAGSLTMSASSSNTALVPNGNILFGGSGANRTVTVMPTAGQTGTSTVTITVNDGTSSASDTFVLNVALSAVGTFSFTNAAFVTIPSVGHAAPYPSVINVSGMAGTISSITATLRGFTHTWPADVDVLLVGPTGQKAMIFSDVGGGNSLNNVTVTLSDSAASSLTAARITAGTYKPTNIEPGETGELDSFSSPAPTGPYTSSLSAFTGTNPNGPWSLYVVDDGPGDQGSLAGGWSLSITTVSGGSLSAAALRPEPLALSVVSHSSTQLVLQIKGPASAYQLEDSQDLNSWNPVEEVSSGTLLTIPIDSNGSSLFFRVVQSP
jgi:subtilisin-like proprotein convertase family protein